MSDSKTFYVTTPIYYVNDKPHIGHAYTTLACDMLARFKRLDGFDVRFLTGTDEHGQKVEKSAQKAGVSPIEFTNRVSQNFRDLADRMNYSHDNFIRTTEDRHKKAAQALWTIMQEKGDIYLDSYSGWYAVRDEAYYGEDELVEGENGQKFAPTGAEVEWVEEPSYFFRLSAYGDKLLKFYEENPDFIQPKSRRNEVMSFVKGGLRDLSISRTTFSWGIPVPNDDKHIMYVWLDALTNYITELGFPEMGEGSDYQKYWPANVHVVGKDILRFHAVYWPAFLMAAELELPHKVFAHGWWTNEGQKISKSVGNVIDPNELVDTYGLDQTRYFMLREVPFGNDGDFSRVSMINRINADLANGLGNLGQRVLSMIQKNCEKAVPEHGDFTAEDTALLKLAETTLAVVRQEIDKLAFHKALEAIWGLVSAANAYIDEQAPWTLRKTDMDRMKTVLFVLAETIRHLGIYIQPIMPESATKLLDLLALPTDARGFDQVGEQGRLTVGAELPKPQGIFPRFVEEEAA